LNGETYILAVRKVDGIRSAIAERDAKAEMIYLDIDEKKETIDKIRQSLQIAEVVITYHLFLHQGFVIVKVKCTILLFTETECCEN